MLKRKYSILVASAGTRLTECTRNIDLFLGDTSGTHPHIRRVTDYLREPKLQNSKITLGEKTDIRELMTNSRPLIEESWNDAIENAIGHLRPNSPYPTIACHLTTFDIETKVFCTPGLIGSFFHKHRNSKDVIEWRPSRVVILIDDIYDMYADLSKDGDVLGRSDRIEKASARFSLEDISESELTGLCELDADVSGLKSVLAWRRAEMIQAENLAMQLDVPLVCLGTKHSMATIRSALRQEPPFVTYLSHPITRYRNEIAASGGTDWNSDAIALNDFANSLANAGVVAVMPTAIDELRFQRNQQSPDQIVPLAPRWPRISSKDGLIGYPLDQHGRESTPMAGMATIPVSARTRPSAETYLRTLEALIFDEIPFRDHFLVNNCDHLLAFRPRADGSQFSGGVKQEIAYWKPLLMTQPHRRIAVVHAKRDMDILLNEFGARLESTILGADDPNATPAARNQANNVKARILNSVAGDAKSYLRGSNRQPQGHDTGVSEFTRRLKMKYNDELAEEVLYTGDLTKYEGPLLEAPRRKECRSLQSDAWLHAVTSPIERSLTYLNIPSSSCRVFVFEELNDSAAATVAGWLRGDGVPDQYQDATVPNLVSNAVAQAVRLVSDCLGLDLPRSPESEEVAEAV